MGIVEMKASDVFSICLKNNIFNKIIDEIRKDILIPCFFLFLHFPLQRQNDAQPAIPRAEQPANNNNNNKNNNLKGFSPTSIKKTLIFLPIIKQLYSGNENVALYNNDQRSLDKVQQQLASMANEVTMKCFVVLIFNKFIHWPKLHFLR